MRKLLLVILLIIPMLLFGQSKKHESSPQISKKHVALYDHCYYHKKYSKQQRLNIYPFNIAGEIQLISFRADVDRVIFDSGEEDTIVMNAVRKPMYSLHNSYYNLNNGRLISSVKLSPQGIDSLTDILYNYGYNPKNGKIISEPTGCYNPRNAILFLIPNGKTREYIEFCFDCEQSRESSGRIKPIVFCGSKFSMLRKFFLERGITYGTESLH